MELAEDASQATEEELSGDQRKRKKKFRLWGSSKRKSSDSDSSEAVSYADITPLAVAHEEEGDAITPDDTTDHMASEAGIEDGDVGTGAVEEQAEDKVRGEGDGLEEGKSGLFGFKRRKKKVGVRGGFLLQLTFLLV